MLKVFLGCLLFFAVFMIMMAAGIIFSNKQLKGSCGGMLLDENGDDTSGSCGICGRPAEQIKLQGCD